MHIVEDKEIELNCLTHVYKFWNLYCKNEKIKFLKTI